MNAELPCSARVYPGLPLLESETSARRARVCIVSNEFVGPSRNGGIGTAYTVLADALAADGHDVTCLYTQGEECASHDLAYWQAQYQKRGVLLLALPREVALIHAAAVSAASYAVYRWLKRNDRFDFIHFPECQALGYYTQLAKTQRLAFARSEICVGLHSMNPWIKEANQEYLTSPHDLQLNHMEQASVELADVAWSPSQYLINWIAARGWKLPARCYVQPYIMPHAARQPAGRMSGKDRPVGELVFFGRLETRKGLALFCDALDRLPPHVVARLQQVTFLGKEATVEGLKALEFLKRRAKAWRFPVQALTDKNQPEAVAYMRGAGRLAIMPSLMENSPNTVYECLGGGQAFLASRAGGIPELIAAEDVDRVCFDIRPAALAAKLADVLGKPFQPARLAFDAAANEQAWARWHRQLPAVREVPPETTEWPKVSLCLTTFNRPELLLQAVESVRAITYPNLEVVLVDDGSTDPAAEAALAQLHREFAERGWHIVRQDNRYLGAARNAAARRATGEFLLFMDDDNYAEPHEITTLVGALLASGADIVTCGMYYFQGPQKPDTALGLPKRTAWMPVGDAVAAGAFTNVFGDANALVRRACFEGVGGFTEDYGVTHEDWEFHARAVLKGYKLQVVPEILFWYRVSDGGMLRTTASYPNHMRSTRPFVEAVPPPLRDLVHYAKGVTQQYADPGSFPAVARYLKLSTLWRGKLEAGRELAAMGMEQDAARMMLSAIKAVETCKQPLIILEALIGTSEHLARLDPGRTRFLLTMAIGFAEKLQRRKDRETAEAMLAALSQPGAPVVGQDEFLKAG